MGFLTNVVNEVDAKKYRISTVKYPNGVWQTAVFKSGISRFFRSFVRLHSTSEEDARKVHTQLENLIRSLPKSDWETATRSLEAEGIGVSSTSSMFGMNRKSRFQHEIKELHNYLAASPIKFATTITEQFEKYAPENDKPSYELLFSRGPPKHTKSHLPQMMLAIEGMWFYLHALNRQLFRPSGERLRETVYDISVHRMVRLFVKMVETQDINTSEEILLTWLNKRELQYSKQPSLLGKGTDDRQTALWVASCTIAEEVKYPKHLILTLEISNALIKGLIDMDLANRVKRIESLL